MIRLPWLIVALLLSCAPLHAQQPFNNPNGISYLNITAPSTPASGTTNIYADSSNKVLSAKNDAGTVSNTVQPQSGPTSNSWVQYIDATGTQHLVQPAFSNLSGFAQGAWTPGITASSTAGTPAYTTQIGTYTVTGNRVTVQFTLILSGWTGSPAGTVSITGLPFTSANTSTDFGSCFFGNYTVSALAASNFGMGGIIPPNGTTISLQSYSNTTSSSVTQGQTGTAPSFIGYCTYHT